jgi:uncharacterized protein (DUF433 family)
MPTVSAPRPDIYGGKDPRQVPIYSVSEVAHHLRLARTTVQSWVRSRGGPAPFARVIVPDDKGLGQRLSFRNLVEVHVLSSLRGYDIPMPRVREAIGFMRDLFATDHPLADIQIHTDRAEIFVKYFGAIVTVSRGGQTALGPVVEQYLERIERDKAGLLQRLYPFVKDRDTARAVAIDPRRKFGRPYLVEVGVETSVIAGRYRAGEKIAAIAADFDTTKDLIERALRFEQAIKKAA